MLSSCWMCVDQSFSPQIMAMCVPVPSTVGAFHSAGAARSFVRASSRIATTGWSIPQASWHCPQRVHRSIARETFAYGVCWCNTRVVMIAVGVVDSRPVDTATGHLFRQSRGHKAQASGWALKVPSRVTVEAHAHQTLPQNIVRRGTSAGH